MNADIWVQISSTEPEYEYQTVRLIQGVEVQHSPKKQVEVISQIPAGKGKGRFQVARGGSYAIIEDWAPRIKSEAGLEVSFYMQSWLPESGHVQTVVSTLDLKSKSGFAVVITESGNIDVWVGTGKDVEVIGTDFKPAKQRWIEVKLGFEGPSFTASLTPLTLFADKGAAPANLKTDLQTGPAVLFQPDIPLMFGAGYAESPTTSSPFPTSVFNGRLDSPTFKTLGSPSLTLLKYDFARSMSSDNIVDISGNGRNGVLINAPTRAVKGHDWDGSEPDWTKATYGYGAIHFHEDDVDDAAWETDFTIKIPEDARSGAYAVEVKSVDGKTSDSVVFFVRPSKKAWKQREGKVAFIISTFTYLAYTNERLYDQSRVSAIDVGPNFDKSTLKFDENFYRMERRKDLGLSNYDVHNDGSGVIYSSSKRPILNVRPGYIMWAFQRPREFSADLMMIGFLEREGIPYEVLTDHDLHSGGVSAITGFNTVLTGSHPEYPSHESYSAYTAYARSGGNLMYLGGNGFYWVSATDMVQRGHRMEVRRGDVGVRSYTLPGGERVHSLNGQQGSMWRSRGRACNVLFGIGFCAEGTDPGVPYKRSEASKTDANLAWIFEGIGEDELIGEFGLGGGASGDEIDRFDVANESPANAIVLATSTGHSDGFGIVPEDTFFPILHTLGTQTDLIRSDIVYYVTSGGGAVFSVGSINWFCSLGWDDYKNNVAKLTGNVIHGFLKGKR
jgi:hypothetical protein